MMDGARKQGEKRKEDFSFELAAGNDSNKLLAINA
jgi:hypothetical protein